jgi:F-type H+-transporting ATPase subunit a
VELTPDKIIYFSWNAVKLNATVVWTWAVMVFLVFGSWLMTRNLDSGTDISRWQAGLELVVKTIYDQLTDILGSPSGSHLPFIATLFLFVATANLLTVIPFYRPPTGSLSTAVALAVCIFVAVPYYGIGQRGPKEYFKQYIEPTFIMLPLNIIGELSRTVSLAIRLFGNIMSGTIIVAILLALVPLFFPIVMRAFGLLTGLIQAYIIAVLGAVYISSGMRAHKRRQTNATEEIQ